ncbi:hypothetical protein KJ903_05550 [Patescibacteria group bacterium]|nr:hypothetical protein [Patescibacteria group bacterium]
MHDLHAADRILKKVLEFAASKKLTKITDIYVDLGVVIEHGEEISPDNFKFNLDQLSQGTIAEGVKVHLKKTGDKYIRLDKIKGE